MKEYIKKFSFGNFDKYIFVSLIALLSDTAIYYILAKIALIAIPVSAALGYFTGMIVAYRLLIRFVFEDRWLKNRIKTEIILFLMSGIIGIAITYYAVFFAVTFLNWGIFSSKIFAVVISFFAVYLIRMFFIFK